MIRRMNCMIGFMFDRLSCKEKVTTKITSATVRYLIVKCFRLIDISIESLGRKSEFVLF